MIQCNISFYHSLLVTKMLLVTLPLLNKALSGGCYPVTLSIPIPPTGLFHSGLFWLAILPFDMSSVMHKLHVDLEYVVPVVIPSPHAPAKPVLFLAFSQIVSVDASHIILRHIQQVRMLICL